MTDGTTAPSAPGAAAGGAGIDVQSAVAAVLAVAQDGSASPPDLVEALGLLRWAQAELAGLEPRLIGAARRAGVSWQELAPVLGVASRQAAERRYLRLAPTADGDGDNT